MNNHACVIIGPAGTRAASDAAAFRTLTTWSWPTRDSKTLTAGAPERQPIPGPRPRPPMARHRSRHNGGPRVRPGRAGHAGPGAWNNLPRSPSGPPRRRAAGRADGKVQHDRQVRLQGVGGPMVDALDVVHPKAPGPRPGRASESPRSDRRSPQRRVQARVGSCARRDRRAPQQIAVPRSARTSAHRRRATAREWPQPPASRQVHG